MTEEHWGNLSQCESYGRHGDSSSDYKVISYEIANKDYQDYQHASHGMIFARSDNILWDLYNTRAAILMQMRFDGLLGFPGGLVDSGEDPIVGLNREMFEEIGLDLQNFTFTVDDCLTTFLNEKKRLILHFFVKEVSLDQFKNIEANAVHAHEHGIESLGTIRPPLFTMADNFRGFPAFLTNQFAGNAKEELLCALLHKKLFTENELAHVVGLAEAFVTNKLKLTK